MLATLRSPYLLAGAVALAMSGGAFAACTGPGAPANTQTKCLTAVAIPGSPLKSYDISFVNPRRAEYYLADRSNKGVDVINTDSLTFKRRLGGFVGFTGSNDTSGPDGVVTHGRWLYAGDGDSTLKVFDLNRPDASALQQTLSTRGATRVDEMDLTTDGEFLLAVNNAENPPYATLFAANGDRGFSAVQELARVTIRSDMVPPIGLSIEQPAWEPKTQRFYVSVPVIANNPPGCSPTPPVTCDGGLLVVDPKNPDAIAGPFNPATNTGVVLLHGCGPNGATVGPHSNVLLGCTTANNPNDKITQVINAKTKNYADIAGIVGSDEVWFNKGDGRYYTGSNRQPGGAVLGVIDGTSVLIETIPQSSGSHSVAADSQRNLIFVPESAQGAGGDNTTVGAGICGTLNGCVGVYGHHARRDHDRDRDDREDRDD